MQTGWYMPYLQMVWTCVDNYRQYSQISDADIHHQYLFTIAPLFVRSLLCSRIALYQDQVP